MKISKLTLSILLIFSFVTLYGQKENNFELLSAKDNSTNLKFTIGEYNLNKVITEKGAAYTVTAENAFSIIEKGSPDLPGFSASVIIPDMDEMTVNVISSKYTDYDKDILIAPSKGNLTRDIDPSTVPYEFGDVYNVNEFYPSNITSLNEPFILRDFRAQTFVINPFQYNPVTKKLRVYTEIVFEVVSTGNIGINTFTRIKPMESIQTEFNNIYSNLFLNYDSSSKYTPLEDQGEMLIICFDDFMDQMQDFVLWKNQRGMKTTMVSKTTAGSTATAIKTYVTNYYNNPDNNLTFLLLIGDATQIPTNALSSGDSDNGYAFITGSDHYQEFFVGRFSAENDAQVATQVLRTIEYEKGTTLANGWLNRTLGIASSEGPGDDNEYDYAHIRNIQTDLLAYTYSTKFETYDGSQGAPDEAGNATDVQVAAAVNSGVGIITYCGHGADTYWVTSGFDVTDAGNLTNDNKLPFIFDVACVNGNFVGQTCFAEAWLRSENGTEPAGAIAMFASTINQSWAPPMVGQDEMIDILTESYVNNIKRTFGGIAINGCYLMNEETSDIAMTDTWTIFGDPSLLVRTDDPASMTISHDATIIIGTTSFPVNCNYNGALACISKDGQIIGTATVVGGVASIPVSNLTPGDFLDLVVTGYNKVSYITQIQVIAPDGAYVVANGYTVADAAGNNNAQADFGETFNLNISLKNVGVDATSGNVILTISTASDYVVNITNNNFNYQILSASQISASTGVFTVQVSDEIPNQTVIPFDLNITDGTDEWSASINVTVNAPEFVIGDMTVAGGSINPGETKTLSIVTENIGNADALEAVSELLGDSPYLTIVDGTVAVSINAQGTETVTFDVEANASSPEGTIVTLLYTVAQGVYSAEANFDLVIGQLPEVTIGTGTIQDAGYPFHTYYNYNKTQILYLGSEIGTGTVNIQEIAFDFAELGAKDLTNLVIKLMPTTATSLSGFVTTTAATTVFTATAYDMPTATGWRTFDIDDYSLNTTGNNLLIEIAWGPITYEYSPYYHVNCTATTNNTVAYVNDDYSIPATADGTSKNRPNINFSFEAQIAGETREIKFVVVDNAKGLITDAVVKVGSLTQAVDLNAETIFNIIEGTYQYVASAPGYDDVTNTFVADANKTINIELGDFTSIYDNEIKFNIYPNPSTGIFNITSNFENAVFNVVDITGRVVYKGIINQNSSLDLSTLTKGAYIFRVENLNKILIIE